MAMEGYRCSSILASIILHIIHQLHIVITTLQLPSPSNLLHLLLLIICPVYVDLEVLHQLLQAPLQLV